MLRKHCLILIVIAIVFCAPVMAFGEDIGGGISIIKVDKKLEFFLVNGHNIEVDFTNDAKGGIILNSSEEPIFKNSEKTPGESKVTIRLPVKGDGIVECKPDLELPLCGYKILDITLSTRDNELEVKLSTICLNQFPQKNSYDDFTLTETPQDDITLEEPPKEVNLDKPIEICFHGEIKQLSWQTIDHNHPEVLDWKPTEFIPLCDKAGNLPPCNKPKPKEPPKPPIIIKVVRAKWYGEDLKILTWREIILGQKEEDENNMDLPSPVFLQDPIDSCIICPDDNGGNDDPPEVLCEVTLINIPQCLNSNQITTWREIIKGE